MRRGKLTVYPSFVLLLCVLLWLGQEAAVAFVLSAALHECGHLLALRLARVPVWEIELRASGAVIHAQLETLWTQALCTAAGPLVNALLLAALFRLWPMAALVNLLLFCYNLLPIYPLDGGRLLRILLVSLFGEQTGERISDFIAVILIVSVAVWGIWLTCVQHRGLYPCLLSALFLCKLPNTPCKMRRLRLK